MSKVVAAVPKGLVKNSAIGALLALACYVALQFVSALLIHSELVGEGTLYSMVCVSAGLAAFLGCGYSVMKGGAGSVLSASAVVLVFMALTVATALVLGEQGAIGGGLTGVGGAMAVGGLAAAVVPGLWEKKGVSRRDGRKTRRSRK